MKKWIFLPLMLLICSVGFAQKSVYVNTETIFKSMPEYTKAITTIENLADSYQKTIDNEFAQIEKMYNDYQRVKASLSESSRARREQDIVERENTVTKYQESVFGKDGELMKKRVELIKPLQERVFKAIESIAKARGYDSVVDLAGNPSVVYYNPALEISNEVINYIAKR